MIVTKIV